MKRYCPRCEKETEDIFHASRKFGLKPNKISCSVLCKICGIVKYGGILEQYKYLNEEECEE